MVAFGLENPNGFFRKTFWIINDNHLDMGDFPVPSENVQPRSSAQKSSLPLAVYQKPLENRKHRE